MTDEQPLSRRAARNPRPERPARQKRQTAQADPAAPVLLDENGKPIAPKGGILAAIRKHPTAWLVSAASGVEP